MYLEKSGTLFVSTLNGLLLPASARTAVVVLMARTGVVEKRTEDRARARVAVEKDAIVIFIIIFREKETTKMATMRRSEVEAAVNWLVREESFRLPKAKVYQNPCELEVFPGPSFQLPGADGTWLGRAFAFAVGGSTLLVWPEAKKVSSLGGQ